MSYQDLRAFLSALDAEGDLVRIREEVDPYLEITVIQHRVMEQGGPALLFENVKGSPFRLVTNLFGTEKRVAMVFGGDPGSVGRNLVELAGTFMPPTAGKLWAGRKSLLSVASARLRKVSRAPVLEHRTGNPDITTLPCLFCWPEDGGPFFTLPLVHTTDPETGIGNLGIYRMQRYDRTTTGMHWQIEKGGGFHFQKAVRMGLPLPVSVILGGPPALTMAAVCALPEGVDERMLASLIMGKPLSVITRKKSGHRLPATAEFILEGSVCSGDLRREGPFGDHLGHYSRSADFPVYRITEMLYRNKPIFPATVVGKPAQEDYHIGVALQEMTMPLLRLVHPGIIDLWAYPETGFHPLAVASVNERYPREALKQAFAILGFGQLSLTKILVVVDGTCADVRDFRQVSTMVWRHLSCEEGIHLIAPTAQDTLDFTGPSMNTGSRLLLIATGSGEQPRRRVPPPPGPFAVHHPDILGVAAIGEAFLMVKVTGTGQRAQLQELLRSHEQTSGYLFHILVSDDVPLDDMTLMLWGWFTRFDPLQDLYPADRTTVGNRLVFSFPILIDATWKKGYRKPVIFDQKTVRSVDKKWHKMGIG